MSSSTLVHCSNSNAPTLTGPNLRRRSERHSGLEGTGALGSTLARALLGDWRLSPPAAAHRASRRSTRCRLFMEPPVHRYHRWLPTDGPPIGSSRTRRHPCGYTGSTHPSCASTAIAKPGARPGRLAWAGGGAANLAVPTGEGIRRRSRWGLDATHPLRNRGWQTAGPS